MTRKQVLVQLDDRLIAALDRAAREEGVSRSELIRRAAAALLEARKVARKERKLVESYLAEPQDPLIVAAAARLAAETAPPYRETR